MASIPPTSTELAAVAKANPEAHTEWEVAFHEAGHVVAEVATGSWPDDVWLNLDGGRGGDHAGRTTSRSHLAAELWAVEPALEPVAQRKAVVLLAGDYAHSLALGLVVDTDDAVAEVLDTDDTDATDTAALRRLVAHLSPADAEQWLESRVREVGAILPACWADVQAVAAALVDRQHIDRAALWDLLDNGPAERWAVDNRKG